MRTKDAGIGVAHFRVDGMRRNQHTTNPFFSLFVAYAAATPNSRGARTRPVRHLKVTDPFAKHGPARVDHQLEWTVENAKRDGVRIAERDAGSQSAGQIGVAEPGTFVSFQFRTRPYPESCDVKVRYELLLNAKHSPEEQYATLAHELAHLYCGHLGTPNLAWWPSRCGISETVREFEAESVAFLVCRRLGIETPSHEYLSGYFKDHISTPAISLNCVLKSAGLIEQMGRGQLGLRKEAELAAHPVRAAGGIG